MLTTQIQVVSLNLLLASCISCPLVSVLPEAVNNQSQFIFSVLSDFVDLSTKLSLFQAGKF